MPLVNSMSQLDALTSPRFLPLVKGLLFAAAGCLLLANLLVLSVHRGIGYGALPLCLVSIVLLFFVCGRRRLESNEWLFIVAMSALPLGVAISMALHGAWDWSNLDKPLRFVLVIPIFLAVRHFGLPRQAFLWGAIGGAITAGSLGYYQKYIEGLEYAHGFTHKIPFGDISLMLGMFSLAMVIPSKNFKAPVWLLGVALIAFVMGLLGSLCSGTRGGWIAIPPLMWLIFTMAIPGRKWRWGVFALFLVGLLGVYFSNALVKHKIDHAVNTTVAYFTENKVKSDAGDRFEMWRGAWTLFKENPWKGVGKENYRPSVEQMKEEGRFFANIYDHPHNDILNLMAELGVLGCLVFLILYVFPIRFFMKWRFVEPQLSCAGLVLICGYGIFSLTQSMLEHNISTSFLALNIAVIAGMLSHSYFKQKSEKQE